MPRNARLDIPGLPRHIGMRGVNGMPCLSTDIDRYVFLKYLREAMAGADFHLHAFVLMTNHVHLLATGHRKSAVSDVMHSVGLRYARYFNRQFDRTGPVFQGRYWSSIIESGDYFFRAMRYIELNPVRAGMVDRPERFPWSSHGHNSGRSRREELTFHDQYLRLGTTAADRASAWSEFVAEGTSQDELGCIRKRFNCNRPFGSADFERHFGDGSLYPSPIPVPDTCPGEPSPSSISW